MTQTVNTPHPKSSGWGRIQKIYLAARYSRNDEMRGVRDVLTALGYEVTSRWIDCHPDITGTPQLEMSLTAERLTAEPESCSKFAQIDIDDLTAADTVISFTSTDGGGKGGRHIEFGLALGLGKRLIIVGPRENVFHTLPQIEHYQSWQHLVMAISPYGKDGLR